MQRSNAEKWKFGEWSERKDTFSQQRIRESSDINWRGKSLEGEWLGWNSQTWKRIEYLTLKSII